MIKNKKKYISGRNTVRLYGLHTCTAALKNPLRTILSADVTSQILQKHPELKELLRKRQISFSVVTSDMLSSSVGKNITHQGISLVSEPLKPYFLEDLTDNIKKDSLVIVCDGITDIGNIGAIIRTAACFDATAVILQSGKSTDERTLAKTSSGGIDIVPIIRETNITRTIQKLSMAGYTIYGLDCAENHNIARTVFHNKSAIVLGSESTGIRRLPKENCDMLLKIPISNLNSLNVSASAAIAMYAFRTSLEKHALVT